MSVDIVNLIESNPITKFSGDYQSKLVEKVKNHFTNYEQQLFLSSFYCYLKYDSKNDYVIDLDNVWKWLGFSQKYNAKCVLEKNFNINKDYKYFAPEVAGAKKDNRGGHNKETIMLNVETFKKFCLKAGTKKADEIHDYFIKLENIMFEITKEECDILKQQLEEIKNKEMEEKILKEKEKILLKEYDNIGNMIYIIKVKTNDDGSYIVKIGHSTKGIKERYQECKQNHKNILLLNCFQVDKSYEFEQFLHSHQIIKPTNVKNLLGHERETELFLIGTTLTLQIIINIINNNIDNHNYKIRELLLEIENLKLKNNGEIINNDNEMLKQLIQTNKLLTNKVSSLENSIQQILIKLNSQQTKVVTGFSEPLVTLGPRLQKMNPETLQLVKVYESVSECMKENSDIKRPSINKAIEECTIYFGFRWLLVERDLDPNIILNIKPTKIITSKNLGYIAKLNKEKTEIINVYLDRKTAALENDYLSSSALDNPVKNYTITNGHYYTLYDNCEQQLKEEFIIKNNKKEPLLYKNGVGQYNSENNLIQEFICKYDCIKSLHISDKTLEKTLTKNVSYNGNYFKYLGCKSKCF